MSSGGFNPILDGGRIFIKGVQTATDGVQFVSARHAEGFGAGTYTPSFSSANARWELTRTPSTGVEKFVVTVPSTELRLSSGVGKKLTGFRMMYTVDTAPMDDITIDPRRILPVDDGVTLPAALSIGFSYDGNHDLAAERGDDTSAPEWHTLIGTISGGGQWLNDGEGLSFIVTVDGDAAGNAEFVFYGMILDYTVLEDPPSPIGVENLTTVNDTPVVLMSLPLAVGQKVWAQILVIANTPDPPNPGTTETYRLSAIFHRPTLAPSDIDRISYGERIYETSAVPMNGGEFYGGEITFGEGSAWLDANTGSQSIDVWIVGDPVDPTNWSGTLTYIELVE